MKFLFSIIFFCVMLSSLVAQNKLIEIDRFGHSYTPHTTPKKLAQIEVGYTRTAIWYGKPYKDLAFLFPQLLMKYGIVENLELRTGANFVNTKDIVSNGTFRQHKSPKFLMGFKYNFVKQKHIIPTISLMADVIYKAPFNLKNSIDTLFDLRIHLLFENKINDFFVVKYATGMEWENQVYNRPKWNYSITPTVQIADTWKAYIELHGDAIKTYHPLFYLGSGLLYGIKNNFLLDINGGYRVSKKDPHRNTFNLYYGAGLSYRF